jgi:hypothetical protein
LQNPSLRIPLDKKPKEGWMVGLKATQTEIQIERQMDQLARQRDRQHRGTRKKKDFIEEKMRK